MTLYDVPMWQSIEQRRWSLQRCAQCGGFRYPPSPICPDDHCMEYEWVPLGGTGSILSWTVFHRKYFDDYPPPYNTIAVRLDEGPIVVSNLVGAEPSKDWIGMRVALIYESHNTLILPRFKAA
jgi:uncharacterized OB-fold protein